MKKLVVKKERSVYSLDKALNFDPNRPETTTGSPFLDEIMRKMIVHHPVSSKAMAKLFGLRPEWFTGAVHCMVGVGYNDLFALWAKREYTRLRKLHPAWNDDAIAPHLGYANRTSLWRFLERTGLKRVPLNVRRATLDDIGTIQGMAEVAFRHTYADILTSDQMEYMMRWMYSTESLKEQIGGEGKAFFIASDSGPCGYVSVEKEGMLDDGRPQFHLQKLYVMPGNQRGGVGRQLFEFLCSWLKSSYPGGCRVELNVNRKNTAAAFYERMGMKRVREGDFHIGEGFYMNDYIYGIDL